MEYRIATEEDFNVLSQMRWNFKMEGKEIDSSLDKEEFSLVVEIIYHHLRQFL